MISEEFEGFSLSNSKPSFAPHRRNSDPSLNAQFHLPGDSPCTGKGKSLGNSGNALRAPYGTKVEPFAGRFEETGDVV